jgi:hypothetical protein
MSKWKNSFASPPQFIFTLSLYSKPGWCSRYSDWLQAGRPRDRSLSSGMVKKFHLYTSPTPVLGPTRSPIQCVAGALTPEVKLQLVPTSRMCGSVRPLPILIHGIVLNSLNTGTSLPHFTFIVWISWHNIQSPVLISECMTRFSRTRFILG